MNLDRVTITGADESVSPLALFELAEEFPFVEWGILVSAKYSPNDLGVPRFPGKKWLRRFQDLAGANRWIKASLHFCGSWVREMVSGQANGKHPFFFLDPTFQRIQLNFHGEALPCDRASFHKSLAAFDGLQVIFQIDGNLGLTLWSGSLGQSINSAPLFDMSHGAGVLPEGWPPPLSADTYHGYAGGLGPDNLAEQIPLIGKAAGDTRLWIDMESNVRSDGDRQFDLAKVRRCLEIAQPFVKG